jgi:hypothetical protein
MTMPWRLVLATALTFTAVVGGVLVAGAAQAQAVTGGTLSISGDSQDSVTRGRSYSYSTSKGDVLGVSSDTGGAVSISVAGTEWRLDFAPPSSPSQTAPGHSPVLAPGTYTSVRRYPGNGTSPGLSLSGAYGCNEVTGSFTVIRAVFGPQGYVQAFDATFVQHCDGVTPAARGEIRISNPPPPQPSPSSTTASPDTTPSRYVFPTFMPTTTGTAPDLAGGGTGTPSATTGTSGADRTLIMAIGLGVIAAVIAGFNVVMGVRTRRRRQEILSFEPRPVRSTTTGGAVMGAWSTDTHDPSPPRALRSLPGKVIAVAVVLALRGVLGLLLTVAIIGALHLAAVQQLSLPSWYANVLWLQVGTCAGEVVSGVLLLRGKEWSRMLGLSVLWFDVAGGTVVMFATAFSCGWLVGTAIDVILIWMLAWPEVRDWCDELSLTSWPQRS